MNRWGYIAIASAIGASAAAVYNYLFAPAPETRFDGSYRSRLDWALAEGQRAATQRELELRAEFEAAKSAPPALPSSSVASSSVPMPSVPTSHATGQAKSTPQGSDPR